VGETMTQHVPTPGTRAKKKASRNAEFRKGRGMSLREFQEWKRAQRALAATGKAVG